MDGLKARLASRNANKARELELLLPTWRIEPLEAEDYPAEDGATYYENARGKALFGRTRAEPDEWVMAEDSGLEVAALAGGPGVQSARSGGDDPVGWLLDQLAGVEDRSARYVSELVVVSPAGEEVRGTGTLEGRIAERWRPGQREHVEVEFAGLVLAPILGGRRAGCEQRRNDSEDGEDHAI